MHEAYRDATVASMICYQTDVNYTGSRIRQHRMVCATDPPAPNQTPSWTRELSCHGSILTFSRSDGVNSAVAPGSLYCMC